MNNQFPFYIPVSNQEDHSMKEECNQKHEFNVESISDVFKLRLTQFSYVISVCYQ